MGVGRSFQRRDLGSGGWMKGMGKCFGGRFEGSGLAFRKRKALSKGNSGLRIPWGYRNRPCPTPPLPSFGVP